MKDILETAKEAAREAGAILTQLIGKTAVTQKGASYNLVTEADSRAEETIRKFLAKRTPDILFYGEESHTPQALGRNRFWIVDPLDGTTNYVHTIPHVGVSIAYVDNGRILAGVVYDPFRDELFSASPNGGASCNDTPIRVSASGKLSTSLIGTGFYYDRGETMAKTLRAMHALFKQNIHCVRRMGAATLDLAYLACGRIDAYFEYTLAPWDFAAGLLIVKEAGGMVSDTAGKPADIFSKGLICSNGLIHEELLKHTLDPKPF